MKQHLSKRISTIMLGGLFLAPIVAQAASDGTVVYGKARASVDFVDGLGALNDTSTRVSSNTSAFGIKGREDLGNGLKAIFQFEVGVNLDDGAGSTGTFFGGGRNSYVGLEGDFGTAFLGIHDTPYRQSTESLEPFHDTLGEARAVLSDVGNGNSTAEFYVRQANSFEYWSPKYQNFQLKALYSPGETSSPTASRDRYSASVVYDNGPYYGSLSYEKHNHDTGAGANGRNTQGVKVGVGYTFVPATKVGFIFENLSQDGPAGIFDRNVYYVSIQHQLLSLANRIGLNTVSFAYGHAGDNDLTKDSGADFYVLGLTHQLSKRTEAFALYARNNNDTNARYGLGTGGTSGQIAAFTPGRDISGFSLGFTHKF